MTNFGHNKSGLNPQDHTLQQPMLQSTTATGTATMEEQGSDIAQQGKIAPSSFLSIGEYGKSLMQTHRRIRRRAGSVTTTYEEMSRVRARSGPDMERSLRWYDLVGLGVGGMVGAGVFITSGRGAETAGPAVVFSFAIAGLCALLSAFCYTEFAVDMPVAGGAFSYLRVTFGELAAVITGANLLMEYVFSNAAVSRSFTAYLGSAIGINTIETWRITVTWLPEGFNQIDFLAVGVVLVISLIICHSTKESSILNMILTGIHLVFIFFIIAVGFWKGDLKNFTHPADPSKHAGGFFPFGVSGVFKGASSVYLSYIGYDAVSTMAEEVKSPTHDIPIGVSGSVALVTGLYCLMAASMCMLVPYDAIDYNNPFSKAFDDKDGWGWAENVIGAGASFGILTSMMVAMLGQARYLCVLGRSNVVPTWLAEVNPKTSTPVNATVFLGGLTAAIAIFTDLEVLLDLVNIGTLFVFYMVANAVVFRRYVAKEVTNPTPTITFLLSFSLISLAFTVIWHLAETSIAKVAMLCLCAVLGITAVQSFKIFVPQARKPEFWGVPFMPWVPAFSIFLNLFLMGDLNKSAYIRFLGFTAVILVFYALYGVHASFDAEKKNNGNVNSVSLVIDTFR